jgi:hypothetical protein
LPFSKSSKTWRSSTPLPSDMGVLLDVLRTDRVRPARVLYSTMTDFCPELVVRVRQLFQDLHALGRRRSQPGGNFRKERKTQHQGTIVILIKS